MMRRGWMMPLIAGAMMAGGCGDFGFAGHSHWMGPMQPPPNQSATADGDKYDAVGTNPFVITSSDPLSTFAADVDTASYDIFRRDIQELERLPNPESVRLEEFVNAFKYDYLKPEWGGEHPFRIDLERVKNPFSNTDIVRIGIQGVDIPQDEKKPANIVFLVDVSGSMSSPNKLGLVKVVIEEALTNLAPTDKVSIVTYAGHEEVALPPTFVSQKDDILDEVDSLDAGGSTAGEAGLALAYAQAQKAFIEGGINHIIMCTDGDFNVGKTSDKGLVEFIREKRKTGVTFTALGFGYGNLNDSMMEKVSNAGNGFYSVISTADHAVAYAHKSLLNTANLIAKDVKIQVQFNPKHVYAYRLLGYENRALADDDFENDAVDAGEVGNSHAVTALYEIVKAESRIPMAASAPRPCDDVHQGEEPLPRIEGLVQVRIRYKHIDAEDEAPALAMDTELLNSERTRPISEATADTQWAVAVAAFAEILKGSPYGNIENLPIIESLVEPLAGLDADRQEFLSLLGLATDLLIED